MAVIYVGGGIAGRDYGLDVGNLLLHAGHFGLGLLDFLAGLANELFMLALLGIRQLAGCGGRFGRSVGFG